MPERLYYNIKEVAAMLSVEPSLLRFWETKIPSLQPKMTDKGVRRYTQRDIDNLRLAHNLIKVRGFKIEAARKMMAAQRGGAEQTEKIQSLLISVRDELAAIKRELDEL